MVDEAFVVFLTHDTLRVCPPGSADLQTSVTKVAKKLFADYIKEKKVREPEVFLHV